MNPKSFLPCEFAEALGLTQRKANLILKFLEIGEIVSRNNPYLGFRGLPDFTREDLELLVEKTKERQINEPKQNQSGGVLPDRSK